MEPLRITRIFLSEIRLPLREPFHISSGVTDTRRILLVELHDADDTIGWSECVAGDVPNYSPETIDTAWIAIREWLAPRILNTLLQGPQSVHAILERDIRGHSMAKAALEMGVWELAARREGIALARLLGGEREAVQVGISLGVQASPEILVEKVKSSFAQGYRRVKMKVKPGADLAYVAAVREAVGKNAPLSVDANSAYTMQDFPRLKELDGFGLLMIEQPLAWDDLVRHATLQAMLRTPICLDESITGVHRVEDMVTLGSGRIVNIKPGRLGGFLSSIAIHDFCRDRGIPVWCGGMLESGIGRAHNVALASLKNFILPGDISPSARYWERDIVEPEWTMDGAGMVRVPFDRPGMGVTVDRDRIDNLTVRREEIA